MRQTWKTDAIFTDHMVLQRDSEIPVWGTGPNGQRFVVACGGRIAEAIASGGRWLARLPSPETGGPYTLEIRSEADSIAFSDVWIGDVWLAGGQSNMQWPLQDTAEADADIRDANHPLIRYYDIPRIANEDEQNAAPPASWTICSPETAGAYSAVAYHFAKRVHSATGVPIGILGCNFGATSAACWMSEERLEQDDALRVYLDEYRERVKDFDWAKYEADEQRFHADFDAYQRRLGEGLEGAELGTVPWPPPMSPRSFMRPSGLYHTMLRKAAPFGIAGFLYYQGEADADKAHLYTRLLSALIDNWRADWGGEERPFLLVQLAAFGCDGDPDGEAWALLREAQSQVADTVPGAGMALALDCGEEHDIHPRNKRTVGERLALVALERVYGMDVESSGPIFAGMRRSGDSIQVRFSHAQSGLAVAGEAARPESNASSGGVRQVAGHASSAVFGFEVGDRNGRFVPVEARIEGDTVLLCASELESPCAVRYGWANYPKANLSNGYGLPARPFRASL